MMRKLLFILCLGLCTILNAQSIKLTKGKTRSECYIVRVVRVNDIIKKVKSTYVVADFIKLREKDGRGVIINDNPRLRMFKITENTDFSSPYGSKDTIETIEKAGGDSIVYIETKDGIVIRIYLSKAG